MSAIDNSGNQSAQSAATGITTPARADIPPVANAGPDQSVPTLVAVAFNGSGSSDADGSIDSYAWNFGDGATGWRRRGVARLRAGGLVHKRP